MKALFNKDYFVRSRISNYKDYRKKKFEQLALDLLEEMAELYPDKLLKVRDFGCGTGGVMNALRNVFGVADIKGTDLSYWAVEWGRRYYKFKPHELHHYNRELLSEKDIDFVLFLDVIEHIPLYEIEFLFKIMRKSKPKFIIARIPVALKEGQDYFLDVSKNDKTHLQAHSKKWWESLFKKHHYTPAYKLKKKAIYDSEGVLARVYKWVK